MVGELSGQGNMAAVVRSPFEIAIDRMMMCSSNAARSSNNSRSLVAKVRWTFEGEWLGLTWTFRVSQVDVNAISFDLGDIFAALEYSSIAKRVFPCYNNIKHREIWAVCACLEVPFRHRKFSYTNFRHGEKLRRGCTSSPEWPSQVARNNEGIKKIKEKRASVPRNQLGPR